MNPAPSFSGASGRWAFLCASAAAFFLQHLCMLATLHLYDGSYDTLPWWFWFNPLRALISQSPIEFDKGALLTDLGMLATLAVDAVLVGLAFRRARQIERGTWAAALVIVPVLQIAAIGWLAAAPDRRGEADAAAVRATRLDARTVTLSVLIGVGLIVGTVTLSTLVFHLYGEVLFLVSPFLIATVVGYLANRRGWVGLGRTFALVTIAFLLGAIALIAFAFEGLVCLVMALPLIAVMGLLGGALGAGLARLGRRGQGTTLASVALIPVLLAAEAALPPHAAFDSVESTDVAAAPAAVWDAIVHMGPIPDPPSAPFRWGLAYPLGGEILGTGVGSVRRGVFSTGVAYERVTEWVPNATLSFVVLSDPPTMRELSPYAHVNSPHVSGYFHTRDARFTLAPLPDGRTRLTLSTRHELDLEPALYWTPMAQWAVHANKVRVLAHFRQQAEAAIVGR